MKKLPLLFLMILLGGSPMGIGFADELPFSFKFGLMRKNAVGRYMVYKETTVIPGCLSDDGNDHRFGYFIEFPHPTTFTEQHVFILPKPPQVVSEQYWHTIPGNTVFKSPALNRKLVTWHNMHQNFDAGDPLGEWILELYLNGRLRKTVHFTVVDCNEPRKAK